MTNIFKMKQQLHDLQTKVEQVTQYASYQHNKLTHALSLSAQTVTTSNVNYLYYKLSPLDQTKLYDSVKDIIKPNQDSYSRLNQFVYMRKFYQKYQQVTHEWRQIKSRFIKPLLQEIKEFEKTLLTTKFDKLVQEFIDIKNELLDINKLTFTLDTICLHSIENDIRLTPISKHDLLQVITVNKDKYTQQVINDAPNELTLDKFTRLIFVDRIEDDQDGYLFEFIFERLMAAREVNPQLAKKMDAKIEETIAPMPKFSVNIDEYGDVVSMEQVFTKPKLTLV